jgi:hypothetical protein
MTKETNSKNAHRAACNRRNISQLIYWEALPTNLKESLLHAIEASWDTQRDGTRPTNIDVAIAHCRPGDRP